MSRQATNERTERISNPQQQHHELVLGVIPTNTSPYLYGVPWGLWYAKSGGGLLLLRSAKVELLSKPGTMTAPSAEKATGIMDSG